MKKSLLFFLTAVLFVGLLGGCSEKSQEDVLKALQERVQQTKGYKTFGSMVLHTGEKPQTYDVEVWHQKPNYFRVALKNKKNEQSQMIIRNDEGVFVLTPALNKSFRFQSDWPENSSQIYLYESLIRDILMDGERVFKQKESHYIFESKTNYQNRNLQVQEIILDKKSLEPKKVTVMDPDRKKMIEMTFGKFQFNPSFDKSAFDVDRNMTGGQMGVPTLATENGKRSFSVLYPTYEVDGAKLSEEKEVKTDDSLKMILTYKGAKSFTLIEQKSFVQPTTKSVDVINGEPVDLGFAIGAMTEKSITWTYNGVDFFLASEHLTQEELLNVARSVYGQAIK